MDEREDKTIAEFCIRLSALEDRKVTVISRPDKDNPGKGGCDAIIMRGEENWALEHTTIDSFENQRADDDRFNKVVVPLEKAIQEAIPDSYVTISVPVGAISTGVDWKDLSNKLITGCIKVIKQICPAEPNEQSVWKAYDVEGITFPVRITRRRDERNPCCHVMRSCPQNQPEQLRNNMVKAIRDKSDQLQPYKREGMNTILILDSDDPSLVNAESLSEAFSDSAMIEAPKFIDEVYIAEADRHPIWFYPVKLGNRFYPELPEHRTFFERQYDLTYGKDVD